MALRLTVLIACLAVPAPAAAGLVTVEFEGVITEIRDDFERLPGVPVGAAFSGSYVYESSVAPTGCLAGLSSGPLTLDECATYRMDRISTAGIRFELEGTEFVFLSTESPRWPLSIHTSLDRYRVSWLRDGSFGMDGTTLESQTGRPSNPRFESTSPCRTASTSRLPASRCPSSRMPIGPSSDSSPAGKGPPSRSWWMPS